MSRDLQRFVRAQDPLWNAVCRELDAGEKRTHWMWFVFPQLAGLGSSAMAQKYALADADEARAYLAHPVLARRLHDAAGRVLRHRDRTAERILGPVDAAKLRSCATLFGRVAAQPGVFGDLLGTFYDGEEDPRTVDLLAP